VALEFWFEFASTYSYPAAMRVEREATAAGIEIAWKPFLLGPIFKAQGWNDSPFNLHPAKGRYMWRDLERTCERLEIPFRRPTRFPRNGLVAARVATMGDRAPWVGDFVRAVYRANFAEDREIGERETIAAILGELGLSAADVLGVAESTATKDRLRATTEEATRRGVFGAPTFFAGDELFWGNDRLEQAIEWARK
jgi:2-hydroxychromene-2-carboxylate isomerase